MSQLLDIGSEEPSVSTAEELISRFRTWLKNFIPTDQVFRRRKYAPLYVYCTAQFRLGKLDMAVCDKVTQRYFCFAPEEKFTNVEELYHFLNILSGKFSAIEEFTLNVGSAAVVYDSGDEKAGNNSSFVASNSSLKFLPGRFFPSYHTRFIPEIKAAALACMHITEQGLLRAFFTPCYEVNEELSIKGGPSAYLMETEARRIDGEDSGDESREEIEHHKAEKARQLSPPPAGSGGDLSASTEESGNSLQDAGASHSARHWPHSSTRGRSSRRSSFENQTSFRSTTSGGGDSSISVNDRSARNLDDAPRALPPQTPGDYLLILMDEELSVASISVESRSSSDAVKVLEADALPIPQPLSKDESYSAQVRLLNQASKEFHAGKGPVLFRDLLSAQGLGFLYRYHYKRSSILGREPTEILPPAKIFELAKARSDSTSLATAESFSAVLNIFIKVAVLSMPSYWILLAGSLACLSRDYMIEHGEQMKQAVYNDPDAFWIRDLGIVVQNREANLNLLGGLLYCQQR